MTEPENENQTVAETVDITRILHNTEDIFKTANRAILEFCDNTLDAQVAGRVAIVRLTIDPRRFIFSSENETGMNKADLFRYLNWGSAEKAAVSGMIGGYGVGSKGEDKLYKIEDPQWRKNIGRERRHHVAETVAKSGSGFVEFEFTNLRKKIDPEKLILHLGNIYKTAIEDNRIRFLVNGREVGPVEIPADGEKLEFSFDLENGAKVTGWAGKLPREADLDLPYGVNPGMRVYLNSRLVEDRVYFGNHKVRGNLGLLIGEVNIAGKVPLEFDKNGFRTDTDEWADLDLHMEEKLADLVQKLLATKDQESFGGKEKGEIRKAWDMFRLAMKRLGEKTYGIAPRQPRLEVTSAGNRKERNDSGVRNPRTPAPEDARGKRERLPHVAFIDFIRRDMGPNIASDVEPAPKGETGYVLVICPRHPMYQEMSRAGVLWLHAVNLAAYHYAEIALKEENGGSDNISESELKDRADRYCKEILEKGKR